MGNWRTVHIVGTVDPSEVAALYEALDPGEMYERFHPLCATAGLAGLQNWAGATIDRVGNLAERNYSFEDVADTLRDLVKVAPSLTLKVHCGGEYEDTACVNTVTVADGIVTVGPPEVEDVGSQSPEQMRANLMRALQHAQRF